MGYRSIGLTSFSRTNNILEVASEWTRKHGAIWSVPWLNQGALAETVPDSFLEIFLKTRDVTAWRGAPHSDFFGQSSVEENYALYKLIEQVRPSRSLEVGVCRGATSLVIGHACRANNISCIHTALDIDAIAIRSVEDQFKREGIGEILDARLANSREWLPQQNARWQFVFLDGDHSYEAVSFEFVETWNRLDVGGVIAMHDVGSVRLGTTHLEGPGQLFFYALDSEIGEHGEMAYVDAAEQRYTLKIMREKRLLKRQVSNFTSILKGNFGLGIVRKVSDVTLSHEPFQSRKFPPVPNYPEIPPAKLTRRVLRAIRQIVSPKPWDEPNEANLYINR